MNALSYSLARLLPGLVERQVLNRTHRTTPTVRLGHDPRYVSRGLHSKDKTTNLSLPELVRTISELSCENNAFGKRG